VGGEGEGEFHGTIPQVIGGKVKSNLQERGKDLSHVLTVPDETVRKTREVFRVVCAK